MNDDDFPGSIKSNQGRASFCWLLICWRPLPPPSVWEVSLGFFKGALGSVCNCARFGKECDVMHIGAGLYLAVYCCFAFSCTAAYYAVFQCTKILQFIKCCDWQLSPRATPDQAAPSWLCSATVYSIAWPNPPPPDQNIHNVTKWH